MNNTDNTAAFINAVTAESEIPAPPETDEIKRLESLLEQSRTAEVPDKRHRIILIAAIVTAFLFTLCFKGAEIRAGLSSVLFFNALSIGSLAVLKQLGMFKRKAGIIVTLPIFALSCFNAYFEYSYYNLFNCLAFFVLLSGMLLYCSGLEIKLRLESFLNIALNRMFHASWLASVSAFNDREFDFEKAGRVILGAVASIPVIMVIGQLLVFADDAFYNAVESFAVNFDMGSLIWTIIVFLCIFVYFCGYFYRFLEDGQRLSFGSIEIDSSAAAAFLTPVNLLFLFFCYSQLSYIGDGVAITDFTTYSRFAHEGFFLLLIVTFINFTIILTFTDILKMKTKGILKLSLSLLCLFTFLLIGSSFYRMYLYMDAYGFTPLRIEVISFLAIESVLVFTTLFSIIKNRTEIVQDFVIAAAVTLMTLNITARPEFSAELNNRYKKPDYDYMALNYYTHSSIPLLIENYGRESDPVIREAIANRINTLYKSRVNGDYENHWQSFNLQEAAIQKTAKDFLDKTK